MSTLHSFSKLKTFHPASRRASAQPPASGGEIPRISKAVVNRVSPDRATSFLALTNEPEDARITGATRSLDRRLLALNLAGSRLRGITTQ